MSIHFEKERYNRIKEAYTAWWERRPNQSIVKIIVEDAFAPDRDKPFAPILSQQNCHDFSYTAEELVDTLDWQLSKYEFLGDSFPHINFDAFGPGVLAAFCGAELDNSTGNVWFHPKKQLEINDIHIEYDSKNKWVQRIKDIYVAGLKKWNGLVLMGMPDLGGILDVVAVFVGTENLLMDLYDEPDEVMRLCRETEIAWKQAYDDLNGVLQTANPGYSDWSGIYSDKPSYIIQSDFSYMISVDMFREFVLPSIERSCKELDHIIYHLDGIGELKHLDDLLKLENLNAVQWQYGDGQPTAVHWVDVYNKIKASKKGIYVVGDVEGFCEINNLVGGNLYYQSAFKKAEMPKIEQLFRNINRLL